MTTTPPKAGPREWIGLATLALPALLASMDLSVLFMAAPWLSADLEPSAGQLLWIMDVYGFFIAGLLITMGTLGDRIGRRKLLLIGAAAFGAASLLAAYSTSPEMLIVARALLGIGGATLAPSTLALIRNMFLDDVQRRTAVAVWTGAFSAGIPLGSIIGGALVEHFWWGSVFLINVPVMVVLLAVAPFLLPEYTDPNPGRFDLVSAGLSIASVVPVIWGIKKLAEDGWAGAPLIAIAVGAAVGALFVRRQRHHRHPLIDVTLFAKPSFSAAIGVNVALALSLAGVGMLIVQHLQLVLGYRPLVAALWMLPMVAVELLGVATGTVIVRWFRPAAVVGTGLAVATVGFSILAQLDAGDDIALVLAGYCVLGFGIGMAITLAYNLVVATAPAQRAGAAAALNETGTEFGGAIGIALLGSIATTLYRGTVGDALPDGLPADAAEAASGTLGGAVAVADQLPDGPADDLLHTAYAAFTDGLATAALVGAFLLAAMTAVVATALRRVPASATADGDA